MADRLLRAGSTAACFVIAEHNPDSMRQRMMLSFRCFFSRRIAPGALLAFVVAALLSGCARESASLVFAVGGAPNECDAWESLIEEFEQRSGIEVTLQRQPTDSDQRRQSLMLPLQAARTDPDVFLMDVAWLSQFAASGWLLPLDSYIEQSGFDVAVLLAPIVNQLDIYEQQMIAMPVYVDCGLLYYRSDLLEKYGCAVPETWEQLVACAQEVQAGEREDNPRFEGFVWQGAQYEGLVCNFLEFIASNGGEIINEEGNLALNTEKNREALQFMKDLIHDYKISPPNTYTEMKEEEVRMLFQSGNALFERNWPYAGPLHAAADSPVRGKFALTLLPKFEAGRHASTLGGWHVGISKYSDRKEDGWKLVDFILSYESQKRLALELGWNPGRKDLYGDPEVLRKMPHLETLRTVVEASVARPRLPFYTQVSEVLQKSVSGALSGSLPVEGALEQAETQIARILDTYRE